MRVEDYKLIVCVHNESFTRLMREALKDGYKPYGAPFVNNGSYCQAVVKYEDLGL